MAENVTSPSASSGTTTSSTPTVYTGPNTKTLLYQVTKCTDTNPARWDLTPKMARYLDKHFLISLLGFLHDRQIYPSEQIYKAQLQVFAGINDIPNEIATWQALHGSSEVPPELIEKKARAIEKIEKTKTEAADFLAFIENEEEYMKTKLSGKLALPDLARERNITSEVMEAAFRYARVQYDTGFYDKCAEVLLAYREIMAATVAAKVEVKPGQPFKDPHAISVLWGKLAAETVLENYDTALADLQALKEALEALDAPQPHLMSKVWIVHWSLFVFFHHSLGNESMLDLFLRHPPYLAAIQIQCPYLLRYLTVAVVTSKRRGTGKLQMRDLIRVIEQEQNKYMDPITGFAFHLFHNFDFDGAQECLLQCENLLRNDFFLTGCTADFMQNAWLQLFELYCKAHTVVGIDFIGSKMGLDPEAAERWVVNLIREARIDARMDQRFRRIVIEAPIRSPASIFREKVKYFTHRTSEVANPSRREFGGRGGGFRDGGRGGRGHGGMMDM